MKRIQEEIRTLEKIVTLRYGYDVVPKVKVNFDLSSSSALGTCLYDYETRECIISLNKEVYSQLGELYIKEVFRHEYGHAVIKMMYPTGYTNSNRRVKPHGHEFKRVCSYFGIDGKATTSIAQHIELPKKKQFSKFYYSCSCLGFKELTSIRHNKVQRGKASYRCSICSETLSFVQPKSRINS